MVQANLTINKVLYKAFVMVIPVKLISLDIDMFIS